MRPQPLRRVLAALAAAAILAALLPTAIFGASPSEAFPVADDQAAYEACGRVFPDPYAYWPSTSAAPGQSPWAKGNVACRSTDFLGWDETLNGLDFIEKTLFPDFVEVYDLSEENGEFADILDSAKGEGLSAGLPTANLGRDRVPMYLIRVTDEKHPVPIKDREHFVYTLSIHGIERAGVEGGIRAVEDLATWAACEKDKAPALVDCEQEEAGPGKPHPILETTPKTSIGAGEALERSSVWFVLSNPDGWRRGDKADGNFFYQRYNGNGMDMNRDWPAHGFTFRPYTPWSEPETRAVGKVLKDIKPKWSGGIDLHGQLIDRAFSFTLIGGNQRPYDKDRRTLQFVKGAWADAETRLGWSSLIKPNDADEDAPGVYGVQWGTIWDTIDYTVTGAAGDWIDSPIGLGADGIDNEMSLSHLSNCGVGTCYIPEAEQLHVDGNKSLIYAMIDYTLKPEDTTFRYAGKAAYLVNPDRLRHPGSTRSTGGPETKLPQQPGFETTMNHVGNSSSSKTVHEFQVKGPKDGFYNGGLTATFTSSNLGGVSNGALMEIAVDQYRPEEDNPNPAGGDKDWQVANSYFNQSFIYLQAGARIDVNLLTPGKYRLRLQGRSAPARIKAQVQFNKEEGWPDPGQLPYDVSNMDFFTDLKKFVASPDKLVPVSIDDVLSGKADLRRFDTVVAADEAFLPGYSEALPLNNPQQPINATVACACSPGAGVRSAATSAYYQFDVKVGNGSLKAVVDSATVADPDLYLQRQLADGSWSGDVASGASGDLQTETLQASRPRAGRYRLEIHNWAGGPGPVNLKITFAGEKVAAPVTRYGRAERDAMGAKVRAFAEQGGNVVLTDNSLRALEWMGVLPANSVFQSTVYAGYSEFSADRGDTDTYKDPLAANVNQPGAAEGPSHRHQLSEPVPIGYSIQDADGGDAGSLPQWGVSNAAWQKAGGRIVGVVGGDDVTLGEMKVGDGRVRIVGSLLTFPTNKYDHPYGLGSYGVTYTGYEVFRNLMDWTNPNGTLGAGPGGTGGDNTSGTGTGGRQGSTGSTGGSGLPATGTAFPWAVLAVTAIGLAAAVRLRRARPTADR